MDPRGFRVHHTTTPTEEERMRPFLWRFWQNIPPAGGIGIFDGSWYSRVLRERRDGAVTQRQWQQAYQEINQFERQLADSGHVIVKFFLHIDKKEQKKRFKQIERNSVESWRIGEEDWQHHKQYDEYLAITEEMLERTSTSYAPWTVVEATDRRFRRVKVFQTVIQAMQAGLEKQKQAGIVKAAEAAETTEATEAAGADAAADPAADATAPLSGMPTVLDRVDLSLSLTKEEYKSELDTLQARLRELEFECYTHRVPVLIGYEGWDAGGKGGSIKRATETMDPRGYHVVPIAAPSKEELAHHYLWRFWKHIPKAGHFAIFDRTWYGRLLVEPIEGFIDRETWNRSFQEINEFEQSLVNFGAVLVKFWIHISQEEQLARFEERQQIERKNYKITDEDWRNREKWDQYEGAVVEMLERTSTSYAPWTIVEGNDKLWARIRALRTIVEAVEKGVEARKAEG